MKRRRAGRRRSSLTTECGQTTSSGVTPTPRLGAFSRESAMGDLYDRLAPLYHLIFPDWDASIERQADQLAGIIHERWGIGARSVLDVSCGIGTQAIGLARRGFQV